MLFSKYFLKACKNLGCVGTEVFTFLVICYGVSQISAFKLFHWQTFKINFNNETGLKDSVILCVCVHPLVQI